jgi:hypothetical protein
VEEHTIILSPIQEVQADIISRVYGLDLNVMKELLSSGLDMEEIISGLS